MAEKALKTSIFSWEGTDKKGAKVKGEMGGQTPALVKAQLRKQGINPIKVRKKSASLFGAAGKKIKPHGHCPVHPADGNHDEGRRTAAAAPSTSSARAWKTPTCASWSTRSNRM